MRKPAYIAVTDAETISARLLPLCAVTGVLFLALACRLGYLQVYRHAEFVKRAGEKTLPARRGAFLDRDGNVLVQTEPTWDVVVDPNIWYTPAARKKGGSPETLRQLVLDGLTPLLKGADTDGKDVDVAGQLVKREGVRRASGGFRPTDVARRVPEEVAVKIRAANLPGVSLSRSEKRVAVDGTLAPQVLGFIGQDGKTLSGLEYRLNKELAGTDGNLRAEFDPKKRTIPGTVIEETPPQHGQDTVLTLDSDIQHIVQDALGAQFKKTQSDSAMAVVLDPKTGDILALANYPMGDINGPKKGFEEWSNRAVTFMYEPGSIMKAVTFAAALEDKIITPNSPYDCSGALQIGRRIIHCHDNQIHGGQTADEVLSNSCNIGTALIARKLGKERLSYYLSAFGFGLKCDSGLPGEAKGLLMPPSVWSDIRGANISFGQGISVTALQMASAYATIANDGVRMRPRIVWGVRTDSGEIQSQPVTAGTRVFSPQTARTLRTMLADAMEKGTGKPARLDGYTAAGKTGTAQFAENGHYGGKFISSFAGMAPAKDPQLVILVTFVNPKGEHYGGKLGGPVFREIAEKTFALRRVSPDCAPLADRIKAAQKAAGKRVVKD